MTSQKRIVTLVVLLVAAAVLHSPVLGVPFFWDDVKLISGNTALQENPFAFWWVSLFEGISDVTYYRPIPFTIIGLVGAWAGFGDPLPFQFVHYVANLTAVGLFFWLCSYLFPLWLAAICGLWFATFPTHVEAFAWLSAFPDVVTFVFALLFFLQLRKDIVRDRPSFALVAYLIGALLSKESGVMLLPFVLLADLPRLKEDPAGRHFRFHLPLWLVFWFYYVAHKILSPYMTSTRADWPQLVPATFLGYVEKVFSPWPLLLLIGHTETVEWYETAGGVVLLLLAAFWLWRTKNDVIRYGLALFLAGFVPVSNFWFVPGEGYLLAERYMLALVAGAVLVTGAVLQRIPRSAGLAAAVTLIGLYGASTWMHYEKWQTPKWLWEEVITHHPEKIGPYLRSPVETVYGWEAKIPYMELAAENARPFIESARLNPQMAENLYLSSVQVYAETGKLNLALENLRAKHRVHPEAKDLILAATFHDKLGNYSKLVSTVTAGAKRYPEEGKLANLAIRHTLLAGETEKAASVIRDTSFRSKVYFDAYDDIYAQMTTLDSFRKGILLNSIPAYTLAYEHFTKAITDMSASEAAYVTESAYKAKMYDRAMTFAEVLLEKDRAASPLIHAALVSIKLEKFDRACAYLDEARPLADDRGKRLIEENWSRYCAES